VPSLRRLVLILLLLGAPLGGVGAQPLPVPPSEEQGAPKTATVGRWVPMVVVAGCAWLGAIVARRLLNSSWFALAGARLGAMLGADALSALGAGGGRAAQAAPVARAAPPWWI